MRRRCRLCREPALEGSLFCDRHRSQAALFSASFAPDDAEERSAAHATAARRPTTARVDATGLAAVFPAALEKIRERDRERGERDAERWPQVSVYSLHNRLLARPYYSIIPRLNGAPSVAATFTLDEECVASAVREGGNVYGALAAQLGRLQDALTRGEVQTLDLHLLTYAGVIAINERLPSQAERNLVTFARDGDSFVEVDPDEVRERLRHERW